MSSYDWFVVLSNFLAPVCALNIDVTSALGTSRSRSSVANLVDSDLTEGLRVHALGQGEH